LCSRSRKCRLEIFDLYLLNENLPIVQPFKEIPSNFKEPEGSTPCSQEPGPNPEPVRSSPYHPILSLLRSVLIISDFWQAIIVRIND
jgi:hypothetical protein